MAANAIDLEQIALELRSFRDGFQTLQLATASADGRPEASYAPFVCRDGGFFVYVSELSRHTRNLAENPRASVMFIENEADAGHLFARRRLIYQCRCEEIDRGSDLFERSMNDMHETFGNLIVTLRDLADFHLYRVSPSSGSYVAGFALAFELVGDGLDQLRHVNDKSHRASKESSRQQVVERAAAEAGKN